MKFKGHELIVGITNSGKTTLAMAKARRFKETGIVSIVLDPMGSPKWISEGGVHQSLLFQEPEKFLLEVKKWQSCALFVDEAGDAIGRFGGVMNQLATRARHDGHVSHFICQRASMIDKNVRANCSVLSCFKQDIDDAIILARNFAQPKLREAATLQQGEYLSCDTFSDVVKKRVF